MRTIVNISKIDIRRKSKNSIAKKNMNNKLRKQNKEEELKNKSKLQG